MLSKRIFSINSELSSIYNICVNFNTENGNDISPTVTLTEASTPVFVATILPLHPSFELKRRSGIKDIFVECHWRTNVRTLISTIRKLKECSLISDEFENEICGELSKYPNAKSLSDDGVEWSNKIVPAQISYENEFNLVQRTSQISILTEREAYSFIKLYSEGSFLVFKKNEVHYLLVKCNSELIEFEILTKHLNKPKSSSFLFPITFYSPSSSNLLFNLKTRKGGLLFGPEGVSANSFSAFLQQHELRQHFPLHPNLTGIKLLKSKEINLKRLAIKALWMHDATLSWLPKLHVTVQDLALFYFLDIFISNLHLNQHAIFNIDSFINTHLYQVNPWVPTYRKHLSLDEIKYNLDILRALAKNGHTNAACMLAIITFHGLTEEQPSHSGIFGININYTRQSHQEPILRDLEAYKEITQNPLHIEEKIFRDLFLLKYFIAKKDKALANNQLKVIDLIQAVSLDQSFCEDLTIMSCIESNQEKSAEQLASNTNLLLGIIKMGRLTLASHIKHLFPDEALKAKDEQDRNILHSLTDHLLKNGIFGSFSVLDLFHFVCRRLPSLLTEPDHQGSTVHDEIMHLKLHRTSDFDIEMLAKLDSILADCNLVTTPRLK